MQEKELSLDRAEEVRLVADLLTLAPGMYKLNPKPYTPKVQTFWDKLWGRVWPAPAFTDHFGWVGIEPPDKDGYVGIFYTSGHKSHSLYTKAFSFRVRPETNTIRTSLVSALSMHILFFDSRWHRAYYTLERYEETMGYLRRTHAGLQWAIQQRRDE